jgi:hypothetical protein
LIINRARHQMTLAVLGAAGWIVGISCNKPLAEAMMWLP